MAISMPVSDWPSSDQSLITSLRKKGGPFDDLGRLAELRETSLRIYTVAYGRWLEWLRHADPAVLLEPPVLRATLPRLKGWLEAESNVRPVSRAMFFNGVLQLLKAAAPEADWSAHIRLNRRLSRVAGQGDQRRKQGRILSSQILLSSAVRHANFDHEIEPTPLARAARQRDGTMVALLAMMPIRHRAFARLQIGHSVLASDKRVTVSLSGDLNKNGLPWEADVPAPASDLLRYYLQETRPFLLARGGRRHDMLWASNNGSPMSYSYVGARITQVTLALTGKKIPPHFFRDAAATTLARASPANARLIPSVLGHAGFKTGERHYNHAGSIEAVHEHAAVIKKLREGR